MSPLHPTTNTTLNYSQYYSGAARFGRRRTAFLPTEFWFAEENPLTSPIHEQQAADVSFIHMLCEIQGSLYQ